MASKQRATRAKSPSRKRQKPRSARSREPRGPLLSATQRCELTGLAIAGAGLVVAAIVAVPGGGSIARPVHDALFTWLGLGAWLLSLSLLIFGGRLLGENTWQRGMLGGVGLAATLVAFLGIADILISGSGGTVGHRVGNELSSRLGTAAALAVLFLVIGAGLVASIELEVSPLANAVVQMWRELRAPRPTSETPPSLNADVQTPLLITPETETVVPHLRPFAAELNGAPAHPDDEVSFVEPMSTHAVPTLPFVLDGTDGMDTVDGSEDDVPWVVPGIELLENASSGKRDLLAKEVAQTARLIEATLASFGIEAKVHGANSGPTVTQYELQPAIGVPVRRIMSYQTDLSLALAAPLRIQAPIPGKSAIGIEVPHKATQLVTLKQVVQSPTFKETRSPLRVALGNDVSGHAVVGDLCRMPHMLIAGATGSGKSVCINAVLAGLLLQATPSEMKLILIDPKRVELTGFADVPHLLVPVVVDSNAAVASLRWAVQEMEERYKLFASHGARNIAAFNERAPALGLTPLHYTVIVIDELADLMMVAAGEIEDLICRIAQLARAVGIHLIVATQRPSADIITGLIKANIPSRIAFAVSSGVDSRVILDEMGAEKLLGRGDMLYLPIDEGKPRRLQGAFVSDRELESIIEFWKVQGKPDYQEEIFHVEATVSWAREATKRDPLFAKAAHVVAVEGRAAASLLQRKLNVGYTRAARLMDQLAEQRIVGPYEGSKSREVLMGVLEVDELVAELNDDRVKTPDNYAV